MCGEPPTLETEQDTDKLDKLLELQRFDTRLYEAFIDVSRYGNAIIKFVGKRLTAVSPQYWFPIVDKSDLKTIVQHVIAYPITPDGKGKMTELYVEIHDIGKIEQRTYSFDSDKNEIGKLLDSKVEQTGFKRLCYSSINNITHRQVFMALMIMRLLTPLLLRLCGVCIVLTMCLINTATQVYQGPSSALSYDDKFQKYYLDLGKYFMRNSTDDPDTKYITWDGNLDSAYKEIETLLTQLYTLSEMGQAFMEGGGGGDASSGTALKLRMVSPRIKAARLKSINTATVKQVISLLALVNGMSLDYDKIQITWNDGLPDDEIETTDRLVTATGGRAIMSQYSALKSRGLSDEQVEAELEQMAEEQANSMPVMLSSVDNHGGNETEGGEE